MIERYSRQEMAALWTVENRYNAWLEVELAVCEAWHKDGKIDSQSMQTIRDKAAFDVARIDEIEQVTRHDVIAFLTAIEEKVGPAARFIHLGCTSSDIVDTANALLLKRAGEKILKDFDMMLDALKEITLNHQGQLCIGRTHGIHAEPTSFALKMAGFYAEFKRDKERFSQAVKGIATGKLSGAVGTYSLLPPHVEKDALEIMGLAVDEISTQVIQRDRYAHYFTALAITAGTIERLCVELRHLQRTEVREAEEGFSKGQKGSSAMPHKKNPISAENMTGLARLIRTNAMAALENQALWHERDISHSSVERVIMPDSTILVDYIMHRLTNLIKNLRVLPENMAKNLKGSFGLFFSQRVLTALIDTGFPRQEAYVLVQKCAMHSWETGSYFPDVVKAESQITDKVDAAVLDSVFDANAYLKEEKTILDRVFSS